MTGSAPGFPPTVSALLRRNAARHGDREAVVAPEVSARRTFRDLDAYAEKVAAGAIASGLVPGDRAVVWQTNRPDWIALQYGLARAGAVLVTANTTLKRDEIAYVLKRSRARALFYGAGPEGHAFAEVVGSLDRSDLPDLDCLIALRGGDLVERAITADEFESAGRRVGPDEIARREAALAPSDTINMQYTSGTTGFPKGVMLTHANILGNAAAIARNLAYTPDDRLCLCVPLFHCFGCVIGTLSAHTAASALVLVETFDPERVLDVIEAERCTALYGVPTMFTAELERQRKRPRDLGTLRVGVMAGSACPERLVRDVVREFPLPGLVIAYGLTEASPGITMTVPSDPLDLRATTVGRPLPAVEVRIVDPTTGRDVPRGTPGELWCRGPNVMRGYDGDEEATRHAITPDGWLRTGDLAEEVEGGTYRIVGRLKELIIRGGENISPAEIEDALRRHPAVFDACAFGIPSRFFGEEVAAAVILRDGRDAGEKELRDFVRARISDQKVPARILFVDSFPLTGSGKIQRYVLRDRLAKAGRST